MVESTTYWTNLWRIVAIVASSDASHFDYYWLRFGYTIDRNPRSANDSLDAYTRAIGAPAHFYGIKVWITVLGAKEIPIH